MPDSPRRKLHNKARKKRRRYERYVLQYGYVFAERYKVVWDDEPEHTKQRFLQLKIDHIRETYGVTVDGKSLRRIEALNKIAGLPLVNIGWQCMGCKLGDSNPIFFDIDHIHPQSAAKNHTFKNLQILCPNCHRRKSQGIGCKTDVCFKIETEAMLQWYDDSCWCVT